ncbi:hypothetical protein Mfer_0838 [Methanothermus fervidus DSM 2088]|uniref:Phospholipase C n=1 Tax=Methanothermus fervidus (strain ATCC 43054 / DSM 2088 / JCM 10308 / V24 S) TaxID=523846 RepID=E3GZA4_METFV|nr:zinc dependent phospholipase C family protein [Methanothermus fervidus]ADP77636.1 hypothetical protein Mfer_0838 [Methanothermus fervidus DSM 2088]
MNIKKYLLLALVLSLPFTFSFSYGWKEESHRYIVELIYNNLPSEYQSKIDLEAMKEGSTAPDLKFKDFKKHHFPPAYYEAKKWLNKGKDAWKKGNYKYASYCFGVATHYISDSFCAPHYVSGESKKDHEMYESQVIDYIPTIRYIPGDLYTLMSSGVSTQEEWDAWLKTRDPNIPRKHFDKAASVAYSAIKDTIDPIEGKDKRGYYPSNTNTTIEQKPLFNNSETIPTKKTGVPLAPLLLSALMMAVVAIYTRYFRP